MENPIDLKPLRISLSLFMIACFVFTNNIVCLDAESAANSQNVALFRRTFQSSDNDNSTTSDLAVDDNVTTCSVTGKQKGANWTVVFDNIVPISQIKMNLGGEFFGQNIELYVSNVVSHELGFLCYYGSGSSTSDVVNVSCFSGPVMARTVTVRNTFTGFVRLCDFQALVCNDGFFGVECTKQCRCDGDSLCDKTNGKCPGLCAPGWNGTDCQSVCADGFFGPSCQRMCHCSSGSACDKQTGDCPADCADKWVGPGCQTEIPQLMTPPTMYKADVTEITIIWHSWIRFVHPSITLLYKIEYKLGSDSHKDQSWIEGPLQADTDHFNENKTIIGLQRNSFYIFRIVPVLRISSSEIIEGGASPESNAFRTKCAVPETPNITDAHSWLDTSRHTPVAVLSVEWMPLTQKQSNCENILYYEIFYQKRGSDWRSTGAKKTEHAKNISSDVSFESEYLVRVVAHNNHPYQSTSDTRIVLTPREPEKVPQKSSNMDVAIIAGVIVCCGLLLALVLAFIMYRQKMKKYTKDRPLVVNAPSIQGILSYPDHCYDELIYPHHVIFPGDANHKPEPRKKRLRKRPPIKVEDLEDYIMSRQENGYEELRKEYRDIPDGNNEASMSIGEKIDNRHKNRFINIIPYNHSRVVLSEKDGDPNSDYINASYLDGYKKPKAYIASQGCNKVSTQDFWRMVWEEGSHRIVMVTNLVEKGKIKCEQYWPDQYNVEKRFHDICVVLTDEEKTADFVIRTLEVRHGLDVRHIKQLHYTTWPDHGVPSRAGPIIAFRRKVRSYDESHPGVIVVHCSAGVGRTGAFIALDYLLDQAKAEGQVDVFGLTCQMRRNRANMIQTVEQYCFVYNALLEALRSGNTVIPCSKFKEAYEDLCRVDPVREKSPLEEQFETLQHMTEKTKPDECLLGEQPENLDKNRFSNILPADKHRPYLMTRVPGTNDYINAVFLDGYRSRNAYIMTQMPLPQTVIDLWRMIYEHKCGTIVMLNAHDDQEETYGQYWPEENEECECGPFAIEMVSHANPTSDIVLRKLKMTYNPSPGASSLVRDAGPRMINHFQLKNWNSEDLLPPSQSSLFALIDLVEQSQKKTGNNPIVIHCHDGVSQSGLYVAVSCIWERLKDDQEVDVFQTVKHLRYYRRQIIQDLAQYNFCYEMVLTYLKEFDSYANFR